MRVVAALGGNALLRRGEKPDAAVQRRNVAHAADALARLAHEHKLVVTHGNRPQVGLLALQAATFDPAGITPLDVLGAESEGMIGYVIEQELANRLPGRDIATLLTQVEVDSRDPAFAAPSKPIGPTYGEADAKQIAAARNWTVARDGPGFRRVVPSPLPRRILEIDTIRLLVQANVVVVCAGGGGIPVVVGEDGAVRGVEAVIDKDRSAALLAASLGAEALIILTDVAAVYHGWDTADRRAIRYATPGGLAALDFAPGSMGPKVEAACRFVRDTGAMAAIGALGDADALLRGETGTTIRAGGPDLELYPTALASNGHLL